MMRGGAVHEIESLVTQLPFDQLVVRQALDPNLTICLTHLGM